MTTPELTVDAVRSLELLDADATPGPWVAVGSVGQVWRGPVESIRGMVKGLTKEACPLFSIEADQYYRLNDETAAREAARADRNLVAEARTRLPALLAKAKLALELESAMSWCAKGGFDLGSPDKFLEECRERGWPGLGEPNGPTMCEDCEDSAATCFHAEDKQHLCDDCCDHEDGCKPVETRV